MAVATVTIQATITVDKTIELTHEQLGLGEDATYEEVEDAVSALDAEEINDVLDNTGCSIEGLDNTACESNWETDDIESDVIDYYIDQEEVNHD